MSLLLLFNTASSSTVDTTGSIGGGGDVYGATARLGDSEGTVQGGGDGIVSGGSVTPIRITQDVIEVVHGAAANAIITQFVIEVVYKRPKGSAWSQIVG